MTCQDSFHEVAFNISFWTRNISSARILFWRGVHSAHFYQYFIYSFFVPEVHKIARHYIFYEYFVRLILLIIYKGRDSLNTY